MKKAFKAGLHTAIPPLFKSSMRRYVVRSIGAADAVWDAETYAARVLNTCFVYYQYSYTEHPPADSLGSVRAVRHEYLAALHSGHEP